MGRFDVAMDGRAVILTGATGGIGRSIAHGLATNGARVCLVDRDQATLDSLMSDLPNADAHVTRAVDLADISGHAALVESAEGELGGLDALVHTAAVLKRQFDLDEVTEADWDYQVDTNLKASFFLNRTVAQSFLRRSVPGRLINFTSQGWWTGGYQGSIAYAASKGGLVSMCRGLARVYAGRGITVNTVSPGAADTPMARGGQSDEEMQRFVDMIPIGRMADPDELVGAVLFLASDLGTYVTGATINVSGGQLMY